jgi:acyl carrier protein
MVAGVWKEVLQLKSVGIHENFIALGGHSLAAIRVTARINSELQMNVPLNKVFTLPTIAEYAHFIELAIIELMK